MKEPIIKFQSPMEEYTADACVVWCFDNRFSGLLEEFIARKGIIADVVKIAGGAKDLTSGSESERDYILGQVQKSIRLHHAKKVILMVHRDCGAYGGSKKFGDPGEERGYLKMELKSARNFLRNKISRTIPIEIYFADADGLYSVEQAEEAAA